MGLFRRDAHHTQWEHARLSMVENQLRARDITDHSVLAAMEKVPRELFVSAEYRDSAYTDGPLPIGEGQTISQPYMVAIMTQCLTVHSTDKILEIGTGSGYQMAVLLAITPQVFSIERIASIAQFAENNLHAVGYEQLNIRVADGSCGWPEEAPFDCIIVTSGAPAIPETLKDQLADGGRLVIPVGSRYSQDLIRVTRKGTEFTEELFTPCVFVPLIGKHGWKSDF